MSTPTLEICKEDSTWAPVGGGSGPSAPAPWVRPADWLPLPVLTVGQQKFVGLYAVYPGDSNFVTLYVAGSCTIDWGDGSAPENYAAYNQANHNFLFASAPSGTLTSGGYRQVIVTATPQGGSNFTYLDLLRVHPQTGLGVYSTGWLDIKIVSAVMAGLILGGSWPVQHHQLQQFEFVGPSLITSSVLIFGYCWALRSVVGTSWTASITNMTNMFSACYSLTSVPLFNTGAVTNMTNMFSNCYSLPSVPLFNTALVTNMTSMFSTCYSLTSVPLFNTALVTTMASMFSGCGALPTVPLFNTALVTSMASMFSGCSSLTSVPLFNTALVTTMTSMLSGCLSLPSVPLFNTALVTNMASMFSACYCLTSVPLFNTALVTSMASMFSSCYSLPSVPLFNTVAVTAMNSMFNACGSLFVVPFFNASGVTNVSSLVNGCVSLQVGALSGTKVSISYASCKLSAAELDAIYTNLASMNLLSANAASVETSVVDWNVNLVNCTAIRRSGTPNAYGSYSLELGTADGDFTSAITTRIAVSPSMLYTFMAMASTNAASGSTPLSRLAVAWYDAGGALIGTDTGVDVTSGYVNVFVPVIVKATSPVNAATASLILSSTPLSVTKTVRWDGMGFFAGDVPSSAWLIGGVIPVITVTGNWGVATDTPSIATAKGWTVTG